MKESLDLKVAEIESLMSEEVKKLEENYNLLHGKVVVIAGAITRLVKFNNEYTKRFQAMSEMDEKMVWNVESNIKAELGPIVSLVLCLPTNAPHATQFLQWGEREVGGTAYSNVYGDDTGVVVRKLILSQILRTIPMKPITVSSITTSTTTNVPKVPLKGILIKEDEGGLSNDLVKRTSQVDLKDKGKVIPIKQSDEEKKKLQAAELEFQDK
ncbi:unnamed protein product [Lactuca saligna]|uniref:Uncharacterized protein n=1 Tax=Lactuca saligna TaxID=75948 RepID=A0AA35VGC7_LACSI|nr:unnamed protein product [Lactuca saligna]